MVTRAVTTGTPVKLVISPSYQEFIRAENRAASALLHRSDSVGLFLPMFVSRRPRSASLRWPFASEGLCHVGLVGRRDARLMGGLTGGGNVGQLAAVVQAKCTERAWRCDMLVNTSARDHPAGA